MGNEMLQAGTVGNTGGILYSAMGLLEEKKVLEATYRNQLVIFPSSFPIDFLDGKPAGKAATGDRVNHKHRIARTL